MVKHMVSNERPMSARLYISRILSRPKSRGPREAALAHFADQGGPFHAQTRRRPGSAAHHPIALPQCVQDVNALRLSEGGWFFRNCCDRWQRREFQYIAVGQDRRSLDEI